jgi:hypothetical protein
VTGAKRRSRFKNILGKLDPHDEVVEDLVAAVVNERSERKDGGRKDSASIHHVEDVVYLDLDDGRTESVGEKEVELDVDSSADEGADECGVKRKRTIRVVIRSRAFL